MSKSKHGPALFEVIRTEPRPADAVRPSLPKWWQDGKPSADAVTDAPATDVPVQPSDPGDSTPTADRPDSPPSATSLTAAPLFELRGGQARLSFTAISGAVVLFGLLVVLTVTYGLGSRAGRKVGMEEGWNAHEKAMAVAVQDEIDAARARQVNPDVFQGVGRSPITFAPADGAAAAAKDDPAEPLVASRRTEQTGGPIWIKGNTYIAVQHFQEARDDALKAQRFLKDNGIETDIVEIGKRGKFSLMTTKGFNTDDPTQKALLDQYWKRIQQIGQAYWKSGGRYKLEGQVMSLTRDQW